MKILDLAFSPCPNDTFVFHALIHGLVGAGPYAVSAHVEDVEALNNAAFAGRFGATKISFYAYLLLKKRYALLASGAALGYGCGPLLVAKKRPRSPARARVAVPGMHTTALLLLRLWEPRMEGVEPMRFDMIMESVASGACDAGLIIHEGRFVYERYGLRKIVDLGEWWERETGLPVPLGCIALRREGASPGEAGTVSDIIRSSVLYARAHPAASDAYVRAHAQEMEDEVIRRHIELYVNDFTVDLGETGMRAVETLEEMARCRGIFPRE